MQRELRLLATLTLVHGCAALSAAPPATRRLNRRAFLSSSTAGVAILGAQPRTANAMSGSAIRIRSYPGIEFLEPIFELKLSLDALSAVASDETRWPALKKRLDSFFGGGPLSEKFYFLGLSQTYVDKIIYADLEEFVRSDKLQRQRYFQDILADMEACRTALDASRPDASLVSSAVSSAKRNMAAWLSLVPEADLVAVDSLFRAVRAADTNQDGKLDEAELRSLTAVDRATWMARVEYVGN